MQKKGFNLVINKKIAPFNKIVEVDSDKSMSIRSFLIGAISHNVSIAQNILESEDILSAIKCLKKLGVKIQRKKRGKYLIYGKGLGSLTAKKKFKIKFWKLWNVSKAFNRNTLHHARN